MSHGSRDRDTALPAHPTVGAAAQEAERRAPPVVTRSYRDYSPAFQASLLTRKSRGADLEVMDLARTWPLVICVTVFDLHAQLTQTLPVLITHTGFLTPW